MLKAKIICKLLFYLARFAGIVYSIIVVYAVVCIITGWNITDYNEGRYLHINYPFSNKAFLNVDNNAPYIIFSFSLPLALYAIFFWLVSNVFKVFYQPQLFTRHNLTQLKRFYLLNLIVPAIATIVASVFVEVESIMWVLVVVHFILGIFTFLLAEIFSRGLQLQHEQDLFI